MNGEERKQGLSEKQPTQGVNVDKLGLYSPAEKASRTERDTMRQRKGLKKRERAREVCVCGERRQNGFGWDSV